MIERIVCPVIIIRENEEKREKLHDCITNITDKKFVLQRERKEKAESKMIVPFLRRVVEEPFAHASIDHAYLPFTFDRYSSPLHTSFRPLTPLSPTSLRYPSRLEPTPFLLTRMSAMEVSTLPSYDSATREELRPSKAEQPTAPLSTEIPPSTPRRNHNPTVPSIRRLKRLLFPRGWFCHIDGVQGNYEPVKTIASVSCGRGISAVRTHGCRSLADLNSNDCSSTLITKLFEKRSQNAVSLIVTSIPFYGAYFFTVYLAIQVNGTNSFRSPETNTQNFIENTALIRVQCLQRMALVRQSIIRYPNIQM